MNSPEQDQAFFEASLPTLETYLLSKELYWPCSVHTPDFTQVTPGALLLVRRRLEGWGAPALAGLALELDALRSRWRSAWDAKASREVRGRSELWRNFLTEARRHPAAESTRQYPYQARLRVIVSLLLENAPLPDEVLALDALLRGMFQEGMFVWDPALARVFPPESFWFLYGTLDVP